MSVTLSFTFEKRHFILMGVIIASPLLFIVIHEILAEEQLTYSHPFSRIWINSNIDMQGRNITDIAYAGIGSESPGRPLHISAAQDANIRLQDISGNNPAAYVEFYNASNRYGWIGLPGAEFLEIATERGKNIVLSPSGNVGIGMNYPLYSLDVYGDVRWSGTLRGGSVPWESIRGYPVIAVSEGLGGGGDLSAGITISIAEGGVTTSKIADSAVDSLKIADSAISVADIADNAVTSAKIADRTITESDINKDSIQKRVAQICASGSSIRAIDADGEVVCEIDDGGENQWISKGNDVYNANTGNVGIGTTDPVQKLTVDGNIDVDDIYIRSAGKWVSEIVFAVNDLYGSFHSGSQCRFLDGAVVDVDFDTICRFSAGACPPGWYQYREYTTTEENICSSFCWDTKHECVTGSHEWSDTEIIETCTYSMSATAKGACKPLECYAIRTQIGCY